MTHSADLIVERETRRNPRAMAVLTSASDRKAEMRRALRSMVYPKLVSLAALSVAVILFDGTRSLLSHVVAYPDEAAIAILALPVLYISWRLYSPHRVPNILETKLLAKARVPLRGISFDDLTVRDFNPTDVFIDAGMETAFAIDVSGLLIREITHGEALDQDVIWAIEPDHQIRIEQGDTATGIKGAGPRSNGHFLRISGNDLVSAGDHEIHPKYVKSARKLIKQLQVQRSQLPISS